MSIASKRTRSFVLFFAILASLLTTGAADSEEIPSPQKIGLKEEAVFKKVLENGLVVLIQKSPPRDLVAIGVTVKAGSASEEEYSGSGISHFVEHMLFKGTASRKAGDIEREIKSYGGVINGAASHDATTFTVTVPAKHARESLLVLKDMFLNAAFDEGEIEKEREVILSEIRLGKDEPDDRLSRSLYETAYINHPYKYPIIGYEEKLKTLKRDALIKYYGRMYVPNRMVIALVGGVETAEASAMIENEFKDFRSPDYRISARPVEPSQLSERRQDEGTKTALSYLAFGFHSTSILDDSLFAMDVLSLILGQGDGSRLNVELARNKRLVHAISAANYTPQDPGLFVIKALLNEENMLKAEEAIRHEIKRIRDGGVEPAELERGKRMILSAFVLSRETVASRAQDMSSSEALTGYHDFSRRYVDGIQAVTQEDIKRAAGKYLKDGAAAVVRLLPKGAVPAEDKNTAALEEDDGIKRKVLPNGLVLLLRRNGKIPAVSITAAMRGGLSAENAKNNGISNLTAQMLLKGTGKRKEIQIVDLLEGRGASMAPFSGYDSFGINLECLRDDLDDAMVILKDILTDSQFPQEELDKERALTQALIQDEDDDIFQKGVYRLRKVLFEDHPYGLRNLGTPETVAALKREDLIKFYKTYCVANNIVISVSGDIEPESLAKRLEDLFIGIGKGELPAAPAKAATVDRANREAIGMDREQSLLLTGFKTISIKDDDRYAFDVLGSIMSGSSGRLFSSLRDKLSLAYALGCAQKLGVDTGYTIFYVATEKDKVDEARKALADEVRTLSAGEIGDAEFVSAKMELLSVHAAEKQRNGFFAFQAALDEEYGLGCDNIYRYEKGIEKVTKEDIKRVAAKYLDPDKLTEVVVSPK